MSGTRFMIIAGISVLCSGLISGCATSKPSKVVLRAGEVATSSAWGAQGQTILNAKAAAGKAAGYDNTLPGAYQSAPVDITGPGTYTFSWQVPATVDISGTKANLAFSFDYPSDTAGSFQIHSRGAAVSSNGTAPGFVTLSIPFVVSQYTQLYTQYSIWIL